MRLLTTLTIALLLCRTWSSFAQGFTTTEFLYGASVYPEIQTREEWQAMLDHFGEAHFNVVRVAESAWGNLETTEGEYDFQW